MTASRWIESPEKQLYEAPMEGFLNGKPSHWCQATGSCMVRFPLENRLGVLAGHDLQLCSTEPDSLLLLLKPM